MRVLLVAPTTDLAHVDSEVQAVVNALHPDILMGDGATVDALMECLQAKQFDLVWFATHGTFDGIEMAGGFMPADTLTQLLRAQGEAALFLNTCDSLGVAVRIHNELRRPVICTVSPVDDSVAFRTGAGMARSLAQNNTLRQAYEDSKPGSNRQFIYLNDSIHMTRNDRIDDLTMMVYDMAQAQHKLSTDVAGLRRELTDYRQLAAERYQRRLTRANTRSMIAGGLVFSTVFLLAIVQVRDALQLSWMAAAIIGVILIAAALYLFGTGYNFPSPFGDDNA